MRKVPKSFQAVVITLIIGLLVPKIVTLTGNSIIVDKLAIKIALASTFEVASLIVGTGYAIGLIHGRKKGGKTRIGIYLILIFLLCTLALPILTAFAESLQLTIYIVGGVATFFGVNFDNDNGCKRNQS